MPAVVASTRFRTPPNLMLVLNESSLNFVTVNTPPDRARKKLA
jgi:hypothetical protein